MRIVLRLCQLRLIEQSQCYRWSPPASSSVGPRFADGRCTLPNFAEPRVRPGSAFLSIASDPAGRAAPPIASFGLIAEPVRNARRGGPQQPLGGFKVDLLRAIDEFEERDGQRRHDVPIEP